jgi:hypothetical protein
MPRKKGRPLIRAAGDERTAPIKHVHPAMDAALKVLFDGDLARLRAGSAERWEKPIPAKAIDRVVETLVENGQKGGPAYKDRLAKQGVACPFHHVRVFIHLACLDGLLAERRRFRMVERQSKAAQMVKDIQDADKRLYEAFRALGLAVDAPHQLHFTASGPASPDVMPLSERNNDLQATAALMDAIDRGREKLAVAFTAWSGASGDFRDFAARFTSLPKQVPPSHNANVWLSAFAHRMAYPWYGLTKEDPRTFSEPFMKFVASAYESIGGETGVDWRQSIRNALTSLADLEDNYAWKGRQAFYQGDDDPDEFEMTQEEFAKWKSLRFGSP